LALGPVVESDVRRLIHSPPSPFPPLLPASKRRPRWTSAERNDKPSRSLTSAGDAIGDASGDAAPGRRDGGSAALPYADLVGLAVQEGGTDWVPAGRGESWRPPAVAIRGPRSMAAIAPAGRRVQRCLCLREPQASAREPLGRRRSRRAALRKCQRVCPSGLLDRSCLTPLCRVGDRPNGRSLQLPDASTGPSGPHADDPSTVLVPQPAETPPTGGPREQVRRFGSPPSRSRLPGSVCSPQEEAPAALVDTAMPA
jgi:hypothetical protein